MTENIFQTFQIKEDFKIPSLRGWFKVKKIFQIGRILLSGGVHWGGSATNRATMFSFETVANCFLEFKIRVSLIYQEK